TAIKRGGMSSRSLGDRKRVLNRMTEVVPCGAGNALSLLPLSRRAPLSPSCSSASPALPQWVRGLSRPSSLPGHHTECFLFANPCPDTLRRISPARQAISARGVPSLASPLVAAVPCALLRPRHITGVQEERASVYAAS